MIFRTNRFQIMILDLIEIMNEKILDKLILDKSFKRKIID